MIIGLTGTHGAGKDTVAQYLLSKGYTQIVMSDFVRKEVLKCKLPPTRDNFRKIADSIRKERGGGWIADEIVKILKKSSPDNLIINGLRNPEEVNILRRLKDRFLVIAVDAPARVRWERTRTRGRTLDVDTFEKFVENEQAEMTNDPHMMQIANVMKMADVVIQNDGTVEELYRKVDAVLAKFSGG